jgi:cysteine synthase A
MLATHEGLFVGISSGTNLHTALHYAKKLGAGKTIVTVLPDDGSRYLSLAEFSR